MCSVVTSSENMKKLVSMFATKIVFKTRRNDTHTHTAESGKVCCWIQESL